MGMRKKKVEEEKIKIKRNVNRDEKQREKVNFVINYTGCERESKKVEIRIKRIFDEIRNFIMNEILSFERKSCIQ